MRTDLLRALLALAVGIGSLQVACGGTGAGLDPATLPPNMQAPYRRFATRCSRCHSLSRPLTAPVTTVEHWEHYLARMKRQPGSGINAADAELILEFLTYYTNDVQGHGRGETSGGDESESSTQTITEPTPASESTQVPAESSEETSDAM